MIGMPREIYDSWDFPYTIVIDFLVGQIGDQPPVDVGPDARAYGDNSIMVPLAIIEEIVLIDRRVL